MRERSDRQGLGVLLGIWILMAALAACEADTGSKRVISAPLQALPEAPMACPEVLCPPCPDSPEPLSSHKPQEPAPAPAAGGDERVDLNLATVEALMGLPGVGRVTAEKIVAYRAQRPFRKTQDLMRVKGIGRARWKKLEGRLKVE